MAKDIRIVPAQGQVNITGSANFRGDSNSSVLFVSASGVVGVGTDNPTTKLYVSHNDTQFLTLDRSGTRAYEFNINSSGTFALADVTGEADRITLLTDGNVGIGTTNPGKKLEVVGVVRSKFNAQDFIDLGSGDSGGFISGYSGGTEQFIIRSYASSGVQAYFNAGNIGIGTSSPATKLNIYSATGRDFRVDQGTANVTTLSNDYHLRLWAGNGYDLQFNTGTSSTRRMTIQGGGNVGINTTSPSAKLQVVGGADVVNIEGSGSASNTSIFSIDGNNGRLFEVSDDLSDSLFSVNTIAGLPVLEVFADNRIVAGAYNQNDLIISGSRIGIGTDAPVSKLNVKDSQDSSLDSGISVTRSATSQTGYINMVGGAFNFNAPTGIPIKFRDGGTPNMTILGDGNVGIGTESPGYKLDINGTVRVQDSLHLGSADVASGHINAYELMTFNIDTDNDDADTRYFGWFKNGAAGSGTSLMRLLETGNLGIGLTAPTSILHVSSSTTEITRLDSANTSGGYLTFANTDSVKGFVGFGGTLFSGLDVNNFGVRSQGSLALATNGGFTRLYIDTAGNVGVGTTNPLYTLEVRKDVDTWVAAIHNTGSDANAQGLLVRSEATAAHDASVFGVYADGGYKVMVKSTGNVGISTTSPGYKLEVNASSIKPTADLLLGEAAFSTSTGYVGMKTTNMGGVNDYMIISGKTDGNTYVSAKDGSGVYIKGGGNLETNRIFVPDSNYIDIDTTTLNVNGAIAIDNSATIGGDLTVGGIVTAQEFHTEFVSASIIYQSGSTQFGNSGDDLHEFTGTVTINDATTANFANYDTNLLVGGDIIARSLTANEALIAIGGDSNGAYIKSGKQDASLTDRSLNLITGEDIRVTVDTTGNVGIGTTNPSYKLDISSDTDVSAGIGRAYVGNPMVGVSPVPNTAMFGHIDNTSVYSYALQQTEAGVTILNATGSQYISFRNENTEAARITSAGDVGIGQTVPNARLEVRDSANDIQMRVGSLTAGRNPFIRLQGQNVAGDTNVYADIKLDSENQMLLLGDPGTSGGSTTANPIRIDASGRMIINNDAIYTTGGNAQVTIKNTGVGGTPILSAGSSNGELIYFRRLGTGAYQFQTYANSSNSGTISLQSYGGNVGIGTTNPDTKLHLYQAAAAPTLLTLHNYQSDINPNGTQGNFIDFKMTDDNATFTPQVRIGMLVQDSDGDGGIPSEGAGNFVVYTGEGTDSNGNGNLTQRLKVSDKGTLTLSAYGAGYLKTDANGVVSVDTSTIEDTLDTVTTRSGTTSNTIQVGGITVAATFPYLDFVDTNSFTDGNDRFRVRAGGDEGLIQWYDDSSASLTSIMTFQPDGTIELPQYGAGLLQTNASGVVSVDTSTYLTAESDTLQTVTTRGNTTNQRLRLSNSQPIYFENPGSGTYNKSVWYHSAGGSIFELARKTEAVDGEIIDFAIGARGGGYNPFFITGSNGYVGINTSSPSYQLDIRGNARIGGVTGDAELIIEADTDNSGENDNPRIILKQDGGAVQGFIGINGDADNAFTGALGNAMYISAYNDIQLRGGSGGVVTVDGNGNVGIGTTAPVTKLHVTQGGSSMTQVYIGNTGTGGARTYYDGSNGDFTGNDYMSLGQDEDLTGVINMAALAGDLRIAMGLTDTIRFTQTGHLLIGSSAKLSAYNNDFTTVSIQAPSGDNASILELAGNRDPNPGNQNGMIQFWNRGGDDTEVGRIQSIQGATTGSGELTFLVKEDGASIAEAMRIAEDGAVGIGTTSPIGSLEIQAASSINGTQVTIANDYGESTKTLAFNNETDQVGYLSVYGRPSTSGAGPYMSLGVSNGTSVTERLRIAKDGSLDFNAYGAGGLKGDATYILGVDSSGNVVETSTSGVYFGTNTGAGTYTGQWQKVLQIDTGNFDSQVFRLRIEGSGNTSGQSIVAEVEFNYKNQNGAIRARTTVNSYGTRPVNKDDVAVYFDTTNLKATFYLKVNENYTAPIYSIVSGRIRNYAFFSNVIGDDTALASETNDSITSNLKFQGIVQDQDSGYVGIGTPAPNTELSVDGDLSFLDSNGTTRLTIGNITTGSPFESKIYTGNYHLVLQAQGSGQGDVKFRTGTTSAEDRMIINSAGNVGIGITNPTYGLYVGNQSTVYSATGTMYVGAALNGSGKGLVIDSTTRNTADNDVLAFEVINRAGGNTMAATVEGRVGIGTASPSNKLHVNGGILVGDTYVTPGSSTWDTSNAQLILGGSHNAGFNTGTKAKLVISGYDNDGSTIYPIIAEDENGLVDFWIKNRSSATNLPTMYFAGLVGVGTTAPDDKLHVNSGNIRIQNNSPILYFYDDDVANLRHRILGGGNAGLEYSADIGNVTSGYHRWDIANAEKMRLTEEGNLGIGTSSPSYKLEVVGGADVVNIAGSGSTANTSIFSIDGNNGRLFEVSDDLSDSLFSVNTIAGLPVLEVFADNRVVAGAYNQNDFVISGSRVGIGTSSPSDKLEVAGVIKSIGGTNNAKYVQMYVNDNFAYYTTNASTIYMNTELQVDTGRIGSYDEDLSLETSGTTRITVQNSDGNVGIGTTAPNALLEIRKNAGADPSPITTPVTFRLTDAGTAATGNGDTTNPWAKIEFYSEDQSSGGPAVQAQIATIYDDIYSAGSHIVFENTATPTNGLSEKMRIMSTGNVGINTSSPVGKLEVDLNSSNSYDPAALTTSIIAVSNKNSSNVNNQAAGLHLYATGWAGSTTGVVSLNAVQIGGNASTADFTVQTRNGGTYAERFRVTAAGDVGIGTTGPASRLHIVGNATANTGEILAEFRNSNNDGRIDIRDEDGANSRPPGVHSATAGFGLGLYASANNAPLIFYAGGIGSERMRISGVDGNVGIGTTSPSKKLHVVGDSYIEASGTGQTLLLERANGQPTVKAGTTQSGHLILDSNTGHIYLNNYVNKHVFMVPGGGSVGVGNTGPAYKLDVTGDIRATGDVIAYSDARVKENVHTLENSLEKVQSLRGVSYNKIGEEDTKVGVIAQEVLEVLPEVVSQDSEGTYSVAYGNITAVLIEAIKEQQKQIDELKKEIQELKK